MARLTKRGSWRSSNGAGMNAWRRPQTYMACRYRHWWQIFWWAQYFQIRQTYMKTYMNTYMMSHIKMFCFLFRLEAAGWAEWPQWKQCSSAASTKSDGRTLATWSCQLRLSQVLVVLFCFVLAVWERTVYLDNLPDSTGMRFFLCCPIFLDAFMSAPEKVACLLTLGDLPAAREEVLNSRRWVTSGLTCTDRVIFLVPFCFSIKPAGLDSLGVNFVSYCDLVLPGEEVSDMLCFLNERWKQCNSRQLLFPGQCRHVSLEM